MASLTSSQERPETQSTASSEPKSFLRRHGAKLVASVIITAGILYTVHKGGFKFVPDGGDFAHVKWWTVPIYVATLVAMSYFRAVRWRFLLREIADVPKKRLVAVSWIGFAAILLMPFRIGEFVRPYMLRAGGGSPSGPNGGKISMAAATSSVVMERVADALFLGGVLAIALLTVPTLTPLPEHVVGIPQGVHIGVAQVRLWGFMMLGLFAAVFVTIAIFYFARSFAHRLTIALLGRVSMKLAEKIAGLFESMAGGLSVLSRGKDAGGFFVETTLYWLCNALGMWLLAWGCGVVHADGSAITFGESCALMGMLGMTILIPGPPGMLGVFQAGICAGMTMYFSEGMITGPGAAYIFLLYLIQFIWMIIAGAMFLFDRRNLRELEEAEGILPEPAGT